MCVLVACKCTIMFVSKHFILEPCQFYFNIMSIFAGVGCVAKTGYRQHPRIVRKKRCSSRSLIFAIGRVFAAHPTKNTKACRVGRAAKTRHRQHPRIIRKNDVPRDRWFSPSVEFLPRTLPKPLRLAGLGARQKFVIDGIPESSEKSMFLEIVDFRHRSNFCRAPYQNH